MCTYTCTHTSMMTFRYILVPDSGNLLFMQNALVTHIVIKSKKFRIRFQYEHKFEEQALLIFAN